MAAIVEFPTTFTDNLPGAPSLWLVPRRRPIGRVTAVWTLAAVALLVLVAAAGLWRFSGSGDTAPVPSGHFAVVGPGDTMWSIAAAEMPAEPRAEAVRQLEELNGGRAELEVGDVVAVPVAGG